MALPKQQVINILTGIIVGFWIISAIVRLWIEWPEAAVLDSLMAPTIGYWFLSKSKNGAAA